MVNRILKFALCLIGLFQIGYGIYVAVLEIQSPLSMWENNQIAAGATEKSVLEFRRIVHHLGRLWTPMIVSGCGVCACAFAIRLPKP